MENKNPLEFSLDFEIKGTNLYLDFAKKTKNLLSKRLFYSLAKQEVEHAQLFDEKQINPGLKKYLLSLKTWMKWKVRLKNFLIKPGKLHLNKSPKTFQNIILPWKWKKKESRHTTIF